MISILNLADQLLVESADSYHAQRATFLSSHALADFRRCPRLFRDKECGLVHEKDRNAFLLGRAVHTLILEGRHTYNAQFAVGGPINDRTGRPYGRDTKAFTAWAAQQPGDILTEQEAALVECLSSAVHGHHLAEELLRHGVAERVGRTQLYGVPCQIRCDWLHPERGLVDLKTCDDLDWFERDARRFGYVHQMSFYRQVLREIGGTTVPVHLIAVEKQYPHRVGVWRIDDAALALAEDENGAAIMRLKECRRNDEWPTGYEGLRVLAA